MKAAKKSHRHFIIFKPYGFLSQFQSNARHELNKKFLGSLFNFPEQTMAIGRLDEKSEGLLLLTTDGETSDYINSSKVEKEYYAQVDGIITHEAIERLKLGVEISINGETYNTKPAKVYKLNTIPDLPKRGKKIRNDRHGPTSWVSITLNEGKFHQVRKMTSVVGFATLRLVRVRIHKILINKMQVSDVIEVENFF